MSKYTFKKCFSFLLAVIMVLSMAGCGSTSSETVIEADIVSPEPVQTKSPSLPEKTTPEKQNTDESSLEETPDIALDPAVPVLPSDEEPNIVPADNEGQNTAPDQESELQTQTPEEAVSEVAVAQNGEEAEKPENTTLPEMPVPSAIPEVDSPQEASAEAPILNSTQRNSINMLNYMSTLTQKVDANRKNQLFLESAYNSFDNLYPNAVDNKTEAQISNLMDRIHTYRMISVKRERLNYIYEQNRAQAIRQAIPNPVALLSAVQSGSFLKFAASALYMAIDAKTSYDSAISQADLQFIKEGWELDDQEAENLHLSTKDALSYLFEMVRQYDLPGDYALSKPSIERFVENSLKPNTQLISKIAWLESHQSEYEAFGPYWLELAKDYFDEAKETDNVEIYQKCLDAVREYEAITTRIFRKDKEYAATLPMAIVSAKQTMAEEDYVKCAAKYCREILTKTEDSDWSLRYFVAQVYLDLFRITDEKQYLDDAYEIVFNNLNNGLVKSQKSLNAAYLTDIKSQKITPDNDATKREKDEIKAYNRQLDLERKIALPPVNEALLLNCDLLFQLADLAKVSDVQKRKADSILHEKGENLFLTEALDAKYWFNKKTKENGISEENVDIVFDGSTITLPALCYTDRSRTVVTITGNNGTTSIDDWQVKDVKRPKNAAVSDYKVTLVSKTAQKYKYSADEKIEIKVILIYNPDIEDTDNTGGIYKFLYSTKSAKKALVFNGIIFERIR